MQRKKFYAIIAVMFLLFAISIGSIGCGSSGGSSLSQEDEQSQNTQNQKTTSNDQTPTTEEPSNPNSSPPPTTNTTPETSPENDSPTAAPSPAPAPAPSPDPNPNPNPSGYTVKFESNGGSDVLSVNVESGGTVEKPEDPTKEGYVFAGWYKDENFNELFIFGTDGDKITKDTTLYAQWLDADVLTAEYALSEVVIGYADGDNSKHVTKNLTLPTKIDEVEIIWTSNSGAVSTNGTVARQATDADVTLTAVASYNGKNSEAKIFEVKVIKKRTRINSEIEAKTIEEAKTGEVTVERNESGDITDIEGQYVDFEISNADDALDAVTVLREELGVKNPDDELEISVVTSDSSGAEYQFQQVHGGTKVFGRAIMVSANSKGEGDFLHSNLLSSDVIAKADSKNDIEKTSAESNAKAHYAGDVEVNSDSTEKIIYSFEDYEEDPIYAYIVNVSGINGGAYIDESVFVNGDTGAVIRTSSNISNAVSGTIRHNIAENEVGTLVVFPVTATNEYEYMIDTTDTPTIEVYTGDVTSGALWWKTENVVKNEIGTSWNDKVAVSAYTNMREIMKWWKDTFDRNSLNNEGMIVKVIVHQNAVSSIENDDAGWVSKGLHKERIYISDKEFCLYSFASAVDILTHETTHAVLQYSTGINDWNLTSTLRAISEGYSDVFGCLKDQDWCIGETLSGDKSGYYLRNMKTKSLKLKPNGGIQHDNYINSVRLISHTAYLMHADNIGIEVGLTWEELGQIWYKSMSLGLYSTSKFEDVRRCVVWAARKISLSQEKIAIIENAFNEVGIIQDIPEDGVSIDEDHFPDSNFRQYVKIFDENKDEKLSVDELSLVKNIDVSRRGIVSLQGIEYFFALTKLNCYMTDLNSLDLSNNISLVSLDCSYTNLTTLNVSNNIALESLNCGGYKKLHTLNLHNCTILKFLWCHDAIITNLYVNDCISLELLSLHDNLLTNLDLSKCVHLKSLDLDNNQLTYIDLSNCPNLNSSNVYCDNNVIIIWPSTLTPASSDANAATPDTSIILATLDPFNAPHSGEYSFSVSLDKTAPENSTLIFSSGSENLSGVFLDDNDEIISMPLTQSLDHVKVSANFEKGKNYSPVISAKSEIENNAGGCNSGIFGILIFHVGIFFLLFII